MNKAIIFLSIALWFVVALVVAPGAAVMAEEKKTFLHQKHLDEGAECDTCHQIVEQEEFPVLNREACKDCHDQGPPSWKLPPFAAGPKVKFPHKKHAEPKNCLNCHAGISKDKRVFGDKPHYFCIHCHEKGSMKLSWTECAACHQEGMVKKANGDCTICHIEDRRRIPPANHRRFWKRRHGQESEFLAEEVHGQACSLCHPNDSCQNCHRNEKPRSHNALWRNRTHGISAAWDRDGCKTCHETGACIRCHTTTTPINHRGSWRYTHGLAAGSRSNEHCAACHSLSWCAACHQGQSH